jgi:hypothetical protein
LTPTAATPSNGDSPKSLAFSCPGSHFAIGAGSDIRDDRVAIQGLAPTGVSSGSALVSAAEMVPESGWALRGRAWCVHNTDVRPSMASGAPYVKDVWIVREQSERNSSFTKLVTAECPTGRKAIGGGFEMVGTSRGAWVRGVSLVDTRLSVRASEPLARETAASWAVAAHAICANITTAVSRPTYAGGPSGSSPGGLSSSQGASARNSAFSKGAVATCRVGEYVVGGGAQIVPATAGVAVTLSRPSGGGAAGTRWIAIATEVNPTLASWEVRAYAKCATIGGAPRP